MEHGLESESLPPELRALVDFLDADDRPAAILRAPLDAKDVGLVYQNTAFRTPDEFNDLVHAISRSIAQDDAWHELQGRSILDGGTWELRRACDHWVAIATSHTAILKSRTGSEVSTVASNTVNYEHVPTDFSGKPCLDWTRVEVPGMSPWIQFLRSFQWSTTALGAMDSWPDILRQYILSIMSNPNPRLIVWGDHQSFVYNEACVPLFGAKHPDCMGQSVAAVFAEAWDAVGPVIDAAYKGHVTKLDQFGPLPIERYGFLESTWWDFTLLPMYGEDGAVSQPRPTLLADRRSLQTIALPGYHIVERAADCFCYLVLRIY